MDPLNPLQCPHGESGITEYCEGCLRGNPHGQLSLGEAIGLSTAVIAISALAAQVKDPATAQSLERLGLEMTRLAEDLKAQLKGPEEITPNMPPVAE